MNWSSQWSDTEYSSSWSSDDKKSKTIKSTPGVDRSWDKNNLEVREIEIHHNNKTRHVLVTIVGDLGLEYDNEGWMIHHIPTGSCFDKAVPAGVNHNNDCPIFLDGETCNCKGVKSYEYDKQPLLNWMARVQENYPTSWQVLRLLNKYDYLDKGDAAKEIIQKWCLSVKVE